MICRCRPDVTIQETREALAPAAGPNCWDRLSQYVGRPVLPMPSARQGIRWLLQRLGLAPGDEVLLQTLTCGVVAEAVAGAGAVPVAFDISEKTFGPALASCEASLSQRSRAVIVTHTFGVSADLAGFSDLCRRHGLLLIEDCAPCIRGTSAGLRVGSAGDCCVYSFKYDKPLSVGWGGAISLSKDLQSGIGAPAGLMALSEPEDRAVAAGWFVHHSLTDPVNYRHLLQVDHAWRLTLARPDFTDQVLQAVRQGADERAIAALCRGTFGPPVPSRAGQFVRRVARALARRLGRPAPVLEPAYAPLEGRLLRAGGPGERILDIQAGIHLGQDPNAEHRRVIADIYRQGLDRNKFVVCDPPEAVDAWLRLPAAIRQATPQRRQAVLQCGRRLGMEIDRANWGALLHQLPGQSGLVATRVPLPYAESLIGGLLNLPVGRHVEPQAAESLCNAMNRSI